MDHSIDELKNHGIYYTNSVLLDLNEIEALTIHKLQIVYLCGVSVSFFVFIKCSSM